MTGVTTVSPTGILAVDAVDGGTIWSTTSLTYSFPTSASFYTGLFSWQQYGSGEPLNNFKAFTSIQQAAITSALAMYSSVSNLTFTQITETSTQSATLRYAESDTPSTAWGYYPTSAPEGGDGWFNNSTHWYDNPVPGNYAWKAMMHETGHMLGLKHPQDAVGSFGAIPANMDSLEYSVMSYRSYLGQPLGGYTNGTWGYPQTLMMYDIAAIQHMYGANFNTNSGDTVYKWNPNTGQEFINGVGQTAPGGNTIFMTIWDGGGKDTYDFSNYTTNLSVNLQPGSWTTVSAAQLADLGAGHVAIGNIANALLYNNNPASLIENAIGGSGNDTITGNTADNILTGSAGNDHLDGISGNDTAAYSGLSANYQVTQNADGSWTVVDLRAGSPDGTDTLNNIEWLQFSDITIALGTVQPPIIAAPIISSVSPDSGAGGDGFTNANILTLTGTAAANCTVKVYDGVTLLGSAVANGSGTWSFATSALTDGAHPFTATATDSSGNTSAASSVMNMAVDTVAPVTPTLSLQSVDSNIVGDNITNVNVISLTGTAESNSTIKVYDGATLLGSATANAEGVWNFVPDLSDDLIQAPTAATITEIVRNSKGGVLLTGTADPDSTVFIYNGATGELLGNATSGSDGKWSFVQAGAAALTFAVSEGGGEITGSNDGSAASGASAAQAWGFTTGPLSNGVHNFTATSTDVAGNTSATSSTLSVTIDTVAPVAPTIASFSTDSGTAGDGITNDNTLTLTGTAEANSTVKVYDGATLLGSATANGSGSWSYTTAALGNGAHSLTATATDVAGNTGTASAAVNVTVDTTAPVAPTISSYSTDSGTAGDGITNDNTLTLTGTAEANSTVKVYDGATLLGSATANGAGAWSYTTAALSNGAHSLTATATDVAGNTGTVSAALNVTVDTTAPVAPTISSFSTDSGTVGDGITNDNTLTLTGTAEANSTVKVYDGATLLGSATANGSGAWSFTTAALSNGAHSLTATATDVAGNTGTPSSALNVTIDTNAPVAPTISSYSTDSGTAGDGITNDNTLTLTGTAEVNSTVKVYDGATLLGNATADGTGAWSYTTAALSNGAHSLTATATDVASNTGTASAALNVTVDATAPVAPTISSYSTDSGTVGDGITNDSTLTLTGTAEANSTVRVYDGATLLGSTTASGAGAWSYTTATLSNGAHSLTATATDVAGNTSTASTSLNVSIDTSAPVAPTISSFSTDSGTVGDGITNDSTLTLTGTAEANSTVKVYDGATLLGTATADGTGAWSYTTAALSNGAHSLTAAATDVAGNTGTASAALNVTIDTSAAVSPTIASFSTDSGTAGDGITNDSTLTLTGTAEANSTVKVYDGAALLGSATANGAGAWSYTTAALSNGAHSLTVTATDVAGNTGTASSALNVTIDTNAPVAPTITSYSTDSGTVGDGITNDNTLTLTGTAEANSTVKVYDGATLLGSATANGAGAWSYTTAALSNGAHSLTATATDMAGNTGVASAALNVTVDATAPVSPTISSYSTDSGTVGDGTTNDSTLTLTGTAEANSTVKVYDGATLLGSATANGSGAWSYTTAALSDGAHSLTVAATDVAGNTGTASSALNVTIDTSAPVAPTISAYSTDSGTAGDGITNDNTLTLSGTAEANSTVKVYDGATLLGSTTASGAGAWSYTTAALGNGAHSLTATAADVAGNTGTASSTLNVTVDTTAPVVNQALASPSTAVEFPGDTITLTLEFNEAVTVAGTPTLTLNDGGTAPYAGGSGTNTLTFSYTVAASDSTVSSLAITAVNLVNGAAINDSAGNAANLSGALVTFPNLQIDPPGTPVINSFSSDTGVVGDGITNASTLTLTGTASATSTVTVYDGAMSLGSVIADGSGNWTFATPTLASGAHSFTATETVSGNTSTASAALNVTVDTTAPVAPTITSYSTDSGTAGDGITNDNTLTLTGTAEAGSTVKVYDGAALLGSTTANGSGAWSFTTAALGNGAHSLTATATDVAGNTGTASSALNVTVDTTAPVAPTITSYSTDSGTAGDGITNDNTLTVTGTAEANSTVKVYDGAALLGSTTANGSGAWSFTTAALGNGAHSLTATGTDVAGNTGTASTVLNVTVDATAPVAPTISSYSTDSGTAGDGITNDSTLTLTGTAEANSTVKVYDGATLLGSATANGAGAWSYTTAALGNGAHSLTAIATDVAGNTGMASAALNVTVDTSAPVSPTITSYSTDSGTAGDGITNDNTLTLTGTAEANSTVKVYDGATLLGSATANGSGAWSFTTAALGNGAHSLTATATDVAGNSGAASSSLNVIVDTTAPATPTIASAAGNITNDNTLTLTGTAEAGSTVKVYDGAALLGTATANGLGAWSYTTAALGNGAHSLTATATDVAGNTGTTSTALSVTVDTSGPVVPSIASFSTDSGVVGDHITSDSALVLTGSAEANSTVKVYDGATLLGSATANGSGAWSFTTGTLADGTHNLTANSTDGAGNTSVASTALSVTVDTDAPTAPTITSGDGVTNDNTLTLTGSAELGSTVKIYDATTLLGTAVVDATGGWSFTTGTLAGGAHDFKATAIDVAGNTSAASTDLDISVDSALVPIDLTISALVVSSKGTGLLVGTSEANSIVSVSNDAGTCLGQATTNSAGVWALAVGGMTAANSIQSYTASAHDQAGNTGSVQISYGTTGNDTFLSTLANEIFTGRGGNDTFIFSGEFGKDTITDFQAGSDVVQLDHNTFANFGSVMSHAAQVGSDVIISVDANNSLSLHNTMLAQLTANNFHLV